MVSISFEEHLEEMSAAGVGQKLCHYLRSCSSRERLEQDCMLADGHVTFGRSRGRLKLGFLLPERLIPEKSEVAPQRRSCLVSSLLQCGFSRNKANCKQMEV